jgi:hypothetical protein
MGLAAERHTMTLDAFLAWESTPAERWGFFGGEAFMMAGGSDVHNLLTGKACMALRIGARGKACTVFMSDVRQHLAETGDLFYPDVFVTCSEASGAEATLALPAPGSELALAELHRDLPDAPVTPHATAPTA